MLGYVYLALMALAGIGVVICAKKQRTNPAMQPIAFVLFVVMLVMLGLWYFAGNSDSAESWETTFYASRGHMIGKTVQAANVNGEVTFFVYPGTSSSEMFLKMVERFKEVCPGEVNIYELALTPEEIQQREADRKPLIVKDFDEMLKTYPGTGVIISMPGLPVDFPQKKFAFMKKRGGSKPSFVLFSRGSVKLAPYFKNGLVIGFIVDNDDANYEAAPPKDIEEAFKMRYVMIDGNNYQDYMSRIGK